MVLTDEQWRDRLRGLEALQLEIQSWNPADPDPGALRCEFSRHRTLAHLRAAQETWLEAVMLFAVKENSSLYLPHPWSLFNARHYELMPYEDHLARYLADRATWLELVRQPSLDRDRGGRLSRKPCTIASLTDKLVAHEEYHVALLR